MWDEEEVPVAEPIETVEEVKVEPEVDQEPEKDVKKNENEIETESDCPILEITDDLEQLQNLPVYKPDRAISGSSLKPFTGFFCELCDRTFETEELSQVFYLYISLL